MASVQDPEARKRLAESIQKYVEERVVKYKFLRGGSWYQKLTWRIFSDSCFPQVYSSLKRYPRSTSAIFLESRVISPHSYSPSGKILRKDMRAWLKPEATAKL